MNETLQPALTLRQQQILALLQSGKVNKEVAKELDIAVGTVKQHIVAIFKKLKVRNRTEAVSRHIDLRKDATSKRATTVQLPGVQLSTRPCVVITLALPKDAEMAEVQALYSTLTTIASAHEAIVLSRHNNAVEVIFGVQHVTEYDVPVALQTASRVYRSLLASHPSTGRKLRGCLTAGLAFASIGRFGDWTGEVIASAAIAYGRNLLRTIGDDLFICDKSALELGGSFGLLMPQDLEQGVHFAAIESLCWNGERRSYPFVGRATERSSLLKALELSLSGHGSLVLIEGEMGMGKTRLCQELSDLAHSKGGAVLHFRSFPPVLGPALYDVTRHLKCSMDVALAALFSKASASDNHQVVIVDDFHLVTQEHRNPIFAAAKIAVSKGKLVVFSGRTGFAGDAPHTAEVMQLRRLPIRDMKSLISAALVKSTEEDFSTLEKDILETATGVPLFAVEIARQTNHESLSLPLLVAVYSRLDKMELDSDLLRLVGRHENRISIQEIQSTLLDDLAALNHQIDRAVVRGVLMRSSDDKLSFTHPMIRRVINNSVME